MCKEVGWRNSRAMKVGNRKASGPTGAKDARVEWNFRREI
jgi:hypothetical protein